MKAYVAGATIVLTASMAWSVRTQGRTSTPLPEHLAGTGLYARGRPLEIDAANVAFAPQYPLWSDGLLKKRWVYLPPGTAIDGANEHEWAFPVGTRFWKEFSRGGRKVETRFMWKTSETEWLMGTYAWNDAGSDAVLAPDAGVPDVIEVAPGRRHSIPSRDDCTACHGTPPRGPLGFTALQLSTDRDPNAVHGEPLQPGMATIDTLVAGGRLLHSRADLLTAPPRIRTSDARTRAVLGYLAANCGMCHDGRGGIAVPGPVVTSRELTEDGDRVARRLASQVTSWQVPGQPDGTTRLVNPGAPELSALFVRLRSRAPSSQMPPLGTVVRDEAAVELVRLWITHAREASQN